jgi:hypothetical protein
MSYIIKDLYSGNHVIYYVDADSPSMEDFIISVQNRYRWPDMNYKKFPDREQAIKWRDYINKQTKKKFLVHETND